MSEFNPRKVKRLARDNTLIVDEMSVDEMTFDEMSWRQTWSINVRKFLFNCSAPKFQLKMGKRNLWSVLLKCLFEWISFVENKTF